MVCRGAITTIKRELNKGKGGYRALRDLSPPIAAWNGLHYTTLHYTAYNTETPFWRRNVLGVQLYYTYFITVLYSNTWHRQQHHDTTRHDTSQLWFRLLSPCQIRQRPRRYSRKASSGELFTSRVWGWAFLHYSNTSTRNWKTLEVTGHSSRKNAFRAVGKCNVAQEMFYVPIKRPGLQAATTCLRNHGVGREGPVTRHVKSSQVEAHQRSRLENCTTSPHLTSPHR